MLDHRRRSKAVTCVSHEGCALVDLDIDPPLITPRRLGPRLLGPSMGSPHGVDLVDESMSLLEGVLPHLGLPPAEAISQGLQHRMSLRRRQGGVPIPRFGLFDPPALCLK